MVNFNPEDAYTDTPRPNDSWRDSSDVQRMKAAEQCIAAWKLCVDVIDARKAGSIILALKQELGATARGNLLREIEAHLKANLDEALVVYLQPSVDKNALRNLRGVEVK